MIYNVQFEDDEHDVYKALEPRSQLQLNKDLQKDAVAGKLSIPAKASRLRYDPMLTVSSQLCKRPRFVITSSSGLLPSASDQGSESACDRGHR